MIADALVWKYGFENGLVIEGDVITSWPTGWPAQPSSGALELILADYTAYNTWEVQMSATDIEIPRALEDVIDALPTDEKNAIATETLTKYNNKKTLRAQEPS